MTRVAFPALMTLVVVAGYVGAASYNRSRAPIVTLTLTERELTLPWNLMSDDRPGLQLHIEFADRSDPLESRNWLTEERLRALGFVFAVPAGAPEAADAYRRMPSRMGWVAFEYDGPAWREFDRRRALQAEGTVWRGSQPSRLVPVDAAPEADVLARRYPSGHLILRAAIGVDYRGSEQGGPLLYGAIRGLAPGEVTVPRRLAPILEGLARPVVRHPGVEGAAVSPRYAVDLAVGPLGVPYVVGLRRTDN
jgi:hypothetical protein